MTLAITIGVILILVIWYVATYNKLIEVKNRVEEAFATIDVYLKKRYDLIPNLVETVKGYAKHESQTLENVISARGKAINSAPEQRVENEKELSQALGRLMMLSESYPDLKANTQFMELQGQLEKIENDLAQSRKYYNAIVKTLNTLIVTIPSNIVASIAKITKADYFQLDDESERKNVKVSF